MTIRFFASPPWSSANYPAGDGSAWPGTGIIGQYSLVRPTLTDGQFGIIQIAADGTLITGGSGGAVYSGTPADNQTNAVTAAAALGFGLAYDGATWDRIRSVNATISAGLGVQAVGPLGQYNSALPTLADGTYGVMQSTANGILMCYLASALVNTTDRIALGDPTTAGNLATVYATGNLAVAVGPAASIDVNLTVTANVDAAVAATTGLRLMGFFCKETTGAAIATFTIIHGATVGGGTVVCPVTLAANESAREFWPGGVATASGLSIDWIAGSIDICLIYAVVI